MSDPCHFDAAALIAEARAIRGDPPAEFASERERRRWFLAERLQAVYLFARRCKRPYARWLEIRMELELIHEYADTEQDGLQPGAGAPGPDDPREFEGVCRI